ncbi:MAG TPA: ABC transporter ATP-binding protein [Candidatus Aminicenantes bacterium]|mgnify:CR=1 FL=1|nr:ABC transporter ATP-binding protein [Candidatus Aminicenantes bacterium]HDT13593.1 ABC transporter ATP-binding protein [Candidatus Aminicenantes bacterium]
MTSLAVETRGLAKRFEAVEAVRSLDLAVRDGDMFALVGPDGAGKTTTIRMLCGLVPPTAGEAKVLGLDLRREAAEIRTRIGYLSQRFSLYGDLTVDENIEFAAEIHLVRDYRKRREELLEFTRLTPFRGRLADRLSGGMRQKLALACTLVHTPRLVFLDEPTTGVDPVSRRDFWAILSALLRSGTTIVMATPYMDEAERASAVGLLAGGRLLAAGTPGEVKSLMRGTVVEIVCPEIRKAFGVLKALAGIREVQLFGDRLNAVVDDPAREIPRIESALAAEGIPVLGTRRLPPSLENVFISVTESARSEAAHA